MMIVYIGKNEILVTSPEKEAELVKEYSLGAEIQCERNTIHDYERYEVSNDKVCFRLDQMVKIEV